MAIVAQLVDGGAETISDYPRIDFSSNQTWPFLVDADGNALTINDITSPWVMAADSDLVTEVTTSSPRSGNKHWRMIDQGGDLTLSVATLQFGTQRIVELNEANQASNSSLVGVPVEEGYTFTASCWVSAEGDWPQAMDSVLLSVYMWDSSVSNTSSEEIAFDFTTTNTGGTYDVQLSTTGTVTGTDDNPSPDYIWLEIRMRTGNLDLTIIKIDDVVFNVEAESVLYVSHAGFRFPYPRWS